MDKKELEFKDITLEEAMKKLQTEKHKIIEAFAKAYLAETGLMPSEVEMCHQQTTNGTVIENVIFFRRKT